MEGCLLSKAEGSSQCTSADSGLLPLSPPSHPINCPSLGGPSPYCQVSLRRSGGNPSRGRPSPALPATRGQLSSAGC